MGCCLYFPLRASGTKAAPLLYFHKQAGALLLSHSSLIPHSATWHCTLGICWTLLLWQEHKECLEVAQGSNSKPGSNPTALGVHEQARMLHQLHIPGCRWNSSNTTDTSCLQCSSVHLVLLSPALHMQQKLVPSFKPFSFNCSYFIMSVEPSVEHIDTCVLNSSRKSSVLLPFSRKTGSLFPYNTNSAPCTRKHLTL